MAGSITTTQDIDLSGATLDLSGFTTAGSYTLLSTTGTITGDASIAGISGRSEYTIDVQGDELVFNLASYGAIKTLYWAGGNGVWESGGTRTWLELPSLSGHSYLDEDHVIFGDDTLGSALAGGSC